MEFGINLFNKIILASAEPTLTAPIMEFSWTSVMVGVTLLVLFLILKKFFFEKVYNFVQQRQATIEGAFDSAEMTNKAADAKLEEYQRRLANADTEKREIIKKAKETADDRAQKILGEAKENANQIVLQAEAEIKRQKQKAMEEMKNEIGALAILAAERILEVTLEKDKAKDDIVNKVIEEVGSSKWQS